MRLKEQRLWDRMKTRTPNVRLRLERIENGLAVGMPDVIALCNALVTWCELKAIENWPAREATPVLGEANGVSRDQRNWHFDWQQYGGRSCVIVSVGLETFLFNQSFVIDKLNKLNKAEFHSEARAIGWDSVFRYLQIA
jgi:hypothetical protein